MDWLSILIGFVLGYTLHTISLVLLRGWWERRQRREPAPTILPPAPAPKKSNVPGMWR